MVQKKKTLKRSIIIGTVFFILLLCIILSVVQFQQYRKVLYSKYESRIEDILRYVEGSIDVDDLAECMRTGVESEKYRQLQVLLDQFKERLDIHYIYIIEPLNTEPVDNVRNVIAGATKYEYENEADELVKLNDLTGDSYSPETAKIYLDAYRSDQLTFFESISEWGDDYTGLLPLYDSNNNRIAALCVDVDVAQIHTTIRSTILGNIALIVALGMGFVLTFLVWSGQNITGPIEELESCVVDLASKCRDQKDPEALKIDVPTIKSNNEIARLSKAISEMSEAMQEYVKNIATAESATRAAETISELRESINALFNNIPGMSFSKDAETGLYLACNQAFVEYAQKKDSEEVLGLTDADMFDSTTAQHFVETDHIALLMDEPYVYYEDVRDAAGNPRHLQTTKLKYTDPTGRLCLLGMCADVTDLRAQTQANSMITAMASDYRCVYYINLDEDDGVCYQDDPTDPNQMPKGVHFPYLGWINRYADLNVTDMYRDGFLDFINPDNIRDRLASQPIIAYRYLAKRGDQEYYEMIRAAGVRRAQERDDHMVHAIGLGFTTIDVEMRESMARNEALAEALAVAEEASKAKTTFLSNMSHEIRTPMNAIIGLDTLALHDESISGQTRDYLEKIGDSARHLLALINDILDMSRIESGTTVLRKEEFSFSAMLDQINTMVMSQCSDKGLQYECRLVNSIDEFYIGDDMKIKEILINILSNAIKFTDAPGSVTLTIEKTTEFEDQSTLRFCIKDTGIGMDKDYIPKIFDTFSQADSSRKSQYGSTGLGMAITRNLVEMMNGTITVESEKGVGTEFTVIITLKNVVLQEADREEATDDSLPMPEQGRVKLAGRRILLAEDMEINAEIMMDVLEMEDVETDHAENGRIVVEMFADSEPGTYSAILMDVRMPEMDGLEAAAAIRALDRPDAKKIPIIALTANAFDEDVQRSLQAGMNAHLSKPVEPDHLYQTLEELIFEAEKSINK